jgi:hypothetical protein
MGFWERLEAALDFWGRAIREALLRTLALFGITDRPRAIVAGVLFVGVWIAMNYFGGKYGIEEANSVLFGAKVTAIIGTFLFLPLFLYQFATLPGEWDKAKNAEIESLRAVSLSPHDRLVLAKSVLRKQALVGNAIASACDKGTLTLEVRDGETIPSDILTKTLFYWAKDTSEALEKIRGEYYSLEFLKLIRSGDGTLGDKFRAASRYLIDKAQSTLESDVEPTFNPDEKLATIEKEGADSGLIQVIDDDIEGES